MQFSLWSNGVSWNRVSTSIEKYWGAWGDDDVNESEFYFSFSEAAQMVRVTVYATLV